MDESAFTYCDPADPLWRRLLIDAVERLTGRETIKRLYLERQSAILNKISASMRVAEHLRFHKLYLK